MSSPSSSRSCSRGSEARRGVPLPVSATPQAHKSSAARLLAAMETVERGWQQWKSLGEEGVVITTAIKRISRLFSSKTGDQPSVPTYVGLSPARQAISPMYVRTHVRLQNVC